MGRAGAAEEPRAGSASLTLDHGRSRMAFFLSCCILGLEPRVRFIAPSCLASMANGRTLSPANEQAWGGAIEEGNGTEEAHGAA
jgi:hypothetical protein